MPDHPRPEGTIHHATTAGRFPAPPGGVRPRTYDDWPTAVSELPIRTPGGMSPPARQPDPGSVPRPAATSATAGVERLRAFIDTVLEMHRVLSDRFIPMCSCGAPARHCPIVKAEHEVLGMVMPFTFDPVRPPYYEV